MDQLHLASSISKSKKRKNFMWSLRPEWITSLLQIMGDCIDANMQSANDFKDSVYQNVALKINEKFGIEMTGEQCKNHIRYQRSIWSHIQKLKKKFGVSWDAEKKMIVMRPEEYLSHIQEFPKDEIYLNVPIANYMDLEKVCGEGHASGEWAKSGSSQSSCEIQHIQLQNDFSQFSEDEVEVREDFVGTSKEKTSSLHKNLQKKKAKVSYVDQTLKECIVMMADSISQVATAIRSSTKYSEEKKMFAELMTELSTIPGFSENEVDIIYDNLASNPTMVNSFLAKPLKSKVRWMRKHLEN